MLTFLSFLIISGMIFMGIGAVIAICVMILRWLLTGAGPMWFEWKRLHYFTTLEFIERTVDEIELRPIATKEVAVDRFGVSAGCLALLLFLPLQLVVNPIAVIVMRRRKQVLRQRVQKLPREQQERLGQEYRAWLAS